MLTMTFNMIYFYNYQHPIFEPKQEFEQKNLCRRSLPFKSPLLDGHVMTSQIIMRSSFSYRSCLQK